MSKDFNNTGMIGRLTRDAELRYTNNGTALTKFAIANNDMKPGPNGGAWIDEVSYFDCVLWGKSGERLNPYLNRGQQVLIKGRMKQERWTDKNDGSKRSKVVIVVDSFDGVQLLGKSQGSMEQKTEEMFQADDTPGFDEEVAF